MSKKQYDDYWKITLAYTDLYSEKDSKFSNALSAVVEYMDAHPYDGRRGYYTKLQQEVVPKIGLDGASLRKAINQAVKLGFVKPFFASYHPLTKAFLRASIENKKTILSKVVYSSARLSSAVTVESDHDGINFLVKTLTHTPSRCLEKKEIAALIRRDIQEYPNGYIDYPELAKLAAADDIEAFMKRKKNQIQHLCSLLRRLEGLEMIKGKLYFKEDAEQIEGVKVTELSSGRDPYLQRIYKQQLAIESQSKCMVEGLAYPVLIASHIKPYRDCNDEEAFDVNNGFLLSKNMDSLFDLGYITFEDNGKIVPSKQLSPDVSQALLGRSIDARYLNSQRTAYLHYHQDNIFKG